MKRPSKVFVVLFLVACGIAVILARRRFDELVIWNLFPVIGAAFILMAAQGVRDITIKLSACASGLVMAATVLCLHLMWSLDIAKMASGSSTASLAFIFIPVWAAILALVAFCMALPVVAFCRRSRGDDG